MKAAGQVDVAVQTEISLPQRVDAFWHCCPSSMTIAVKERPTGEMACDTIDAAIIKHDANVEDESEAVYYTQGEAYIEATDSANRDPRQRDSIGVRRQIPGGDDLVKTPI